jgi:hypothetical protein
VASPNLGWRAPGPAEAAALPVAGGAFAFVVDSDGVVAAGRLGNGAGLSLSWHPATPKTELLPTISAITWRDKDEIRIVTSRS